ncbi:hypothetical protein ABZ816_33325 [Actinosynnema sp. NPDC047251]|uniref:hypothetical protein n=1 Tax=Saccharothrix espanaensis TaxID=103731 RepID=UPI0002ED566B
MTTSIHGDLVATGHGAAVGVVHGNLNLHPPPPRPAPVVPRQLPAAPALFAGRSAELAGLDRVLTATAAPADPAGAGQGATVLVSAIGGAGGIGKTWLALAWAHRRLERFPDGQLFVDLRGFSPAGEPVRGFLDALEVDPRRIPPPTSTPRPRSTAAWWPGGGCSSCWTTPPPASRSCRCCPARRPARCWSPAVTSWPR